MSSLGGEEIFELAHLICSSLLLLLFLEVKTSTPGLFKEVILNGLDRSGLLSFAISKAFLTKANITIRESSISIRFRSK
jgi:hypothetical protein